MEIFGCNKTGDVIVKNQTRNINKDNNAYKRYMTICIAAVCCHKKKDTFVISTDHMIDVGIGQFEHDIKKYKVIKNKNSWAIAMLSGNALLFNELLENVKGKNTFLSMKNQIFNNFRGLKRKWIQRQLLDDFGLKEKDIKKVIQEELKNQFIGKLVEKIAKSSLKTQILFVGFDNGKAKIAEIYEDGHADFSDIHFRAIGSGYIQAINTLLFQKQIYTECLSKTIYNVYKAKRNAEVVAGVGKDTDILVFKDKEYWELEKSDIALLSSVYEKELNFSKNAKELNNLKIINNIV